MLDESLDEKSLLVKVQVIMLDESLDEKSLLDKESLKTLLAKE